MNWENLFLCSSGKQEAKRDRHTEDGGGDGTSGSESFRVVAGNGRNLRHFTYLYG